MNDSGRATDPSGATSEPSSDEDVPSVTAGERAANRAKVRARCGPFVAVRGAPMHRRPVSARRRAVGQRAADSVGA